MYRVITQNVMTYKEMKVGFHTQSAMNLKLQKTYHYNRLNNTSKTSSFTLHFKMPLTFKAWNKSFGNDVEDARVSRTELQVALLISGFLSVPRISKDLRASNASSKLIRVQTSIS